MVLYLCQHGDAVAKDVDPDRPLSDRGAADIGNMAGALNGSIEIDAIVHSGKTRARQTAELFHERLAPNAPVHADAGLGPTDPVEDFVGRLASGEAALMVVGHMPFVGRLASYLLGQGERDILQFQPGTVAALSRGADGDWLLAWMLTPALVSD